MRSYSDIRDSWATPETIEELEFKIENFGILFAYHSGRIENDSITYADTREIFENGKVVNFTGDLRTLFEIQNQKYCYEFLKEKILLKEKISPTLIKDIHRILLSYCYDERRYAQLGEHPGEFRVHEFSVGKNNVGLLSGEIASEIDLLCGQIEENQSLFKKDNILDAAAWFHLNFEYIHPFADGNGRVGRTLLNYFLLTNDHPPVIIYDEDKKEYYQALEVFDAEEDIKPFRNFLEKEVVKTWNAPKRERHCQNLEKRL